MSGHAAMPDSCKQRSAVKGPAGPTSLADLLKGKNVPGDSGVSPASVPPWYEPERYSRIKPWFEQHAFTLSIAWYQSLTVGFVITPLLDALVFTGESNTPEKAHVRYNDTFKHMIDWHTGDIFDAATPSKAFTSIEAVRNLHASVRKDMMTHAREPPPDGATQWMSMYNMATVQSGFMGAITTKASYFGLSLSDEAKHDYIHFWRCVGHQLAISDEFNLCGAGSPATDNIVAEIWTQLVQPGLANPPSDCAPMTAAFMGGLNEGLPVPVFSAPSAVALVCWMEGAAGPSLSAPDQLRFALFRTVFVLIRYFPLFERIGSALLIAYYNHLPPPAAVSGCPFARKGASAKAVGLDQPSPHGAARWQERCFWSAFFLALVADVAAVSTSVVIAMYFAAQWVAAHRSLFAVL